MGHIVTRWVIAVVFAFLFNSISAYIVPKNLESRELCLEDNIYLSLKEYIYDADPWCRTQLEIVDVINTGAPVTERTFVFFRKLHEES